MKLARILTILSVCVPVFAQGVGPASFDAISLKPYKSNAPSAGEYSLSRVAASGLKGGPGTSSPERITATGITLQRLVAAAYGVLGDQVSGPAWMTELDYLFAA